VNDRRKIVPRYELTEISRCLRRRRSSTWGACGHSRDSCHTHIFQSADDPVKIQTLRLLGQTTGTCFQRCVGPDALNATYATTYEVGSTRDDGATLPGYERSSCASGPRCK